MEASTGWACTDCLVLLANGETDPDWTEAETAEYLARVSERNATGTVTLGIVDSEHECHDADGERADECECERKQSRRRAQRRHILDGLTT